MLEFHQLWTFAIAAFFLVLIPGPNMTYIISCAVSHGKRAAFIALLGSNMALVSLGVIIGMGFGTLLHTIPFLYNMLKIAGAVYLFWLAWKSISSTGTNISAAITKTFKSDAQLFKTGYLTNFLNPKAYAFYIAIFPGFLNTKAGYMLLQGAALGFVHAFICFMVDAVIILFVKHIAGYFNSNNTMLVIKKWGTAFIFIAFGIRMLI